MMTEERKFLDLDMVAERIPDSGDQGMFREAVQCYHIGSHRAAVILVWIATAECLKRHLEKLADENDGSAQKAMRDLKDKDGKVGYEETLINQCKTCDLIDDYEEKCLEFARNIRSKCAHPSGVVPSAEAVRHILEICSQVVLCRTGLRGTSFIENTVTIQFDSPYFLPNEEKAPDHCRHTIKRVPKRLWHLFPRVAAEKRPTSASDTWRKNARTFFKILLAECDEQAIAQKILNNMHGFEAQAREFFASLVGLNVSHIHLWEDQKRAQARAILKDLLQFRSEIEYIEAWANICEHDGIEQRDKEFLRERLVFIAPSLPDSFIRARDDDILQLLAEMAEDDGMTDRAAASLRKPFVSVLCAIPNEYSERLLRQIIERFTTDDKHREVVEDFKSWNDGLLIQFLKLTEEFLLQCSEDRRDDVLILFGSATELAQRNPLLIPESLTDAVKSVLSGNIQSEWQDETSETGALFKSQLELLIGRSEFSSLQAECTDLLEQYRVYTGDAFEEDHALEEL